MFSEYEEQIIKERFFGTGAPGSDDLQKLDDVTASATEIDKLAAVTAGVVSASKAVVVGATKNLDTLLFNVQALAAAGSGQSDAGAITGDTVLVSAADDTKAVKLPVAVVGRRIIVINGVADKKLPLFPNTDGTINGGSANAGVTIADGGIAVCYASSATAWHVDLIGGTASAHMADLAATVVKTDVDDGGTIDGTEVAAFLQAIHLKINAIILALEEHGIVATS